MPSTHDAGLVTVDGYVHAVNKTVLGSFAACGAGRIVQQLPRLLRADEPNACPRCLTASRRERARRKRLRPRDATDG